MKSLKMLLAMVAVTFALTACNKEEAAPAAEAPAVEEAAPVEAAPAEAAPAAEAPAAQ